jgi:hypothetical protein
MAGSLREASTLILASRTEGAKHGYALTKDIESFGRGARSTSAQARRPSSIRANRPAIPAD